MFKINLKYSKKFYAGIVLFALNFVIGAIVKILFLFKFKDLGALKESILSFNSPNSVYLWILIIVYLISWAMLVIGIWWIGAEYTAALKKYFSYRYYHESFKRGTKKALTAGAAGTRAVGKRMVNSSFALGTRVKGKMMANKNGAKNSENKELKDLEDNI